MTFSDHTQDNCMLTPWQIMESTICLLLLDIQAATTIVTGESMSGEIAWEMIRDILS